MNGTTGELIGRDHHAALLAAQIDRAIGSHGGLVLVTGEAGIGKTTLVSSAAARARDRGALVAAGTCWESGSAPGYWPWVQALRALRRAAGPERWERVRWSAGDMLDVLLGEADRDAGAAPDGFQVYDAVTGALVTLSQWRPVVVVLDDLHFADPASLRLLAFAARQTWFERLLLIGTYRDTEAESPGHPLRELLSPLALGATTLSLTGLDRSGVAALMARVTGVDPPPDLAAEMHARTGGNPFFVEQTARLWHGGGAAGVVPPGVRDALHRRLCLLPGPVAELLPAASVLGRRFDRQVLAAVAGRPAAHVDRLLEQAVVAKLVAVEGDGVYSFVHDLVRETLYESLDDPRDLHAAVVEALAREPGLAGRVLPGDLARHAHLAGDRVDPEHAVELHFAAARDAGGRFAVEEHLGHLRRAHELSRAASLPTRVRAALDLGEELVHAGMREEARRALGEAAGLARELGDPSTVARVAITWLGTFGLDEALPHLREAHAALVGGDAPDDRLALDLIYHLAAEARADGDDDALTFTIWAQHDVLMGPGTADERVRLVEELIGLARRKGDLDLEHLACALRWVAMIEQGDPAYLDRFQDYLDLSRRAERPRIGFNATVDHSIVAALGGRFAEAERLLDRLGDIGPGQRLPYGSMIDHHRWAMLGLRGRFAEQERMLSRFRGTQHPCPGLVEGLTALRVGDLATALRRLADPEPRHGMVRPLWLRFQAEVAAVTRDPELCARAREALTPHRGRWAVALMGWDVSGPFDLWLGLVEAASGRWDEAIAAFGAAAESADRMLARPWAVTARVHLGEALLAAGVAAAGEVLDRAGQEAEDLGMRHLVARVRELRPASPPGGPAPHAASGAGGVAAGTAPEPGRAEFTREGSVWSLVFAGRGVHLPDAKGLRDLHTLLSSPGADVPAVRLLDPAGGELVVAARRMGGDDVLDEEAKARYRQHLSLLDEEIDRAAELGDDCRAAELDRERAALLEELRRAAGLGGRARRLGDEAERARKTVTARIRDVLRKLDDAHPELAAHLRATVSTGTTCRYQPDAPISWRL